jgi:hypothetical protein
MGNLSRTPGWCQRDGAEGQQIPSCRRQTRVWVRPRPRHPGNFRNRGNFLQQMHRGQRKTLANRIWKNTIARVSAKSAAKVSSINRQRASRASLPSPRKQLLRKLARAKARKRVPSPGMRMRHWQNSSGDTDGAVASTFGTNCYWPLNWQARGCTGTPAPECNAIVCTKGHKEW